MTYPLPGSFNRGDKEELANICCEGLYSSLRRRIAARPVNETLVWSQRRSWPRLPPRIVSRRMTKLPLEKSALRQLVFRIKSVQTLARVPSGLGQESDTDRQPANTPRRLVEYLVLQKRIFKGNEGPWKVWGTINETGVRDAFGDGA